MCKQNKKRFFDKFLPTGIVIALLLSLAFFLFGDIVNPGKLFKNQASVKLPELVSYSISFTGETGETIVILKEHIEL